MLSRLFIRNLGLIDRAELEFDRGLNILSGETGAGKSMIIDAMNLALGMRADRDVIMIGQHEAQVEVVFDIHNLPEVKALLDEVEIDSEDGELILSRRINDTGRNSCRVNGYTVSLSQLKKLADRLFDILGQHEHYSLLDEGRHIELLDGFAAKEIEKLRRETAQYYTVFREVTKKLDDLFSFEADRERRADFLSFEISEIERVSPKIGEDAELEQKIQMLRHMADIEEMLTQSTEILNGGIGESAQARCEEAAGLMRKIARFSEQYATLQTRLEQVGYELEDILRELQNQRDVQTYDVGELDALEKRSDAIRSLKRRYGGDIETVLQTLQEKKEEILDIETYDSQMENLKFEREKLKEQLLLRCAALSELRHAQAEKLSRRVEEQLKDLGMQHARFEVRFDPLDKPIDMRKVTARGYDTVRFYICPNPGQPMRPLVRIASGGEMSRIMLALKNISAMADAIPTLIFDEVDTGISGKMALAVAQKLAQISRSHQVICVTHSAQIAAMGDAHLVIRKKVQAGVTRTHVTKLSESQRVEEISRLVAGDMSELGRQHAAKILQFSRDYRHELDNSAD